MAIKNLIFDFGGVLYYLDYMRTSQELSKLSKNTSYDDLTLQRIIDLPAEFEKGLITEEQFRKETKIRMEIECDDLTFDKAWNAMLLGLKPESVDFISRLKPDYSLAMLSNTNIIHHEFFNEETKELLQWFDKIYFSYKIGMRKPDIEIYNYSCSKSGYLPEETLFIDDNIANIEAAKMAGLHTFHFYGKSQLSDILHSI